MDNSTQETPDTASILAWYVAMGVDEAVEASPIDRFDLPPPAAVEQANAQPEKKGPTPIVARPVKPANGAGAEIATKTANNCQTTEELYTALCNFDGGMLKRSSKNTVFADGSPDADLMIVGDAPGFDEDRDGKPFMGPNGRMLDKMLTAIGLDRDKDVYLTDVLPWRPLGNTRPDPEIIAMCTPFLKRHIALTKPKHLLLMGTIAAQSLLDSKDGISRLRGRWQEITLEGHSMAAMVTYHPQYLINQPQMKGATWRDLLAVKERLVS